MAAPGSPPPLVVCGPSGVGKGTLIARLTAAYPSLFGFSVSHTTRAPRPGEVDGTHYHFTTSDAFLAAVDQGLFLEHAHVHGNLYGTTLAAIAAVRDAGKVCILDLDVQGAESVKSARLGAKFLFVAPPSMDELERRLRGRGTETEEKIRVRLENAQREMSKRDEPGFFDVIIINDELDAAYAQLTAFINEHVIPLA